MKIRRYILICIIMLIIPIINITLPMNGFEGILEMAISLSSADASFNGEVTEDRAGYSVCGAGDVNGDGFDDILIGAPYNKEKGDGRGQTYLIFGKPNGWFKNFHLSKADASFYGELNGDYSGMEISSAGDVNCDGFDDILISSYYNEEGGFKSGQIYLILGKADGWNMDTPLSSADASFIGEFEEDQAGRSISSAGDVNGDGFDDILIGAPYNDNGKIDAGQTYLILGKENGWKKDIILSSADASFLGENFTDVSGFEISGVGDVNGDGFDDFMIGAHRNDGGNTDAGKTYLIFGMKSGWGMDFNLSNANASFIGENADDLSGISLSGGDFNGDGLSDIIIGAYTNDEGGSNAGQSYLIFGRENNWSRNINLAYSSASFIGEHPDDLLGRFCSLSGDVNDDGYDDIIISSYRNDELGSDTGKSYLILGNSSDGIMDIPISSANASFIGENAGDYFGYSVSSAGDVNGDGYDDILIGANMNDDGGTRSGKTYIIFYKKNPAPEIINQNILVAYEDELYSVLYTASDSETPEELLKWNMTANAEWLDFNISTQILSGLPTNDDVGSYWVNITVTDERNGINWTNFTLVVENTNDPPEIINICHNQTAVEDVPYSTKYDSEDIDPVGDILRWNLTTDAEWLKIDPISGYLNGTPRNEDVGQYWVNITISDGNNGTDWIKFMIKVNNTNDAPEILTVNNNTALEDILYSVKYDAIDIDPTNDTLTWRFSTNSDWLEFDPSNGYLNGIPGNDDVGSYWVDLSVSDGNNGVDRTNFTLNVVNVNDPPLIINDDIFVALEDIEYYNQYTAIDIDPTGDELTWALSSNAEWLEFDEITSTLSGIPTNDDVGFFWVNITVSDDKGNMSWRNFTLEVQNTNDPPEISHGTIHDAVEGEIYNLQYFITDIDPTGDTLNFDFKSNAEWISFDDKVWNLSGVPGNGDAGVYWANLTVKDDKGGITYSNITINAIGVNSAPEWGTFQKTYEIEAGHPLSFQVSATDYDIEDSLTYSLNGAPYYEIKIDSETGWITWSYPIEGKYILNVSVTDGNATLYTLISLKIIDDHSENGNNPIPFLMISLISISFLILILILIFIINMIKRKDKAISEE